MDNGISLLISSLVGGYSTVNCAYNFATNAIFPEGKVSLMSFKDACSLYTTCLTLDLPIDSFLMMSQDQNGQLFNIYRQKILTYDTNFFALEKETRNYSFFCKVQLEYNTNYSKYFSQDLSSFPQKRTISPDCLSYHQRQHILKSGRNYTKSPRLVSACHPAIVYQHLESIFFEAVYLGATVVEVFEIIRSRSTPVFRDYISKLNQKRGQEKSPIHARTIKSLSNCLTGLID